jgi:adenylate kinase family enzyme
MDRIIVIGPLGSGKTTLSRRLSEITGIPHVELDKLRLNDGGDPVPKDEWNKIESSLLAQERWIFDGASIGSLDVQLSRADTLIVVHIPRHRSFYQWIKREIRSRDQWFRWRWRALRVAWSWASLAMPSVWAIKLRVTQGG